MKKPLLFLAIILIKSAAFSQCLSTDSIVTKVSYEKELPDYYNYRTVEEFHYHTNNGQVDIFKRTLNGSSWTYDTISTTYTDTIKLYNQSNQLTYLSTRTFQGSGWVDQSRNYYAYSPDGEMIQEVRLISTGIQYDTTYFMQISFNLQNEKSAKTVITYSNGNRDEIYSESYIYNSNIQTEVQFSSGNSVATAVDSIYKFIYRNSVKDSLNVFHIENGIEVFVAGYPYENGIVTIYTARGIYDGVLDSVLYYKLDEENRLIAYCELDFTNPFIDAWLNSKTYFYDNGKKLLTSSVRQSIFLSNDGNGYYFDYDLSCKFDDSQYGYNNFGQLISRDNQGRCGMPKYAITNWSYDNFRRILNQHNFFSANSYSSIQDEQYTYSRSTDSISLLDIGWNTNYCSDGFTPTIAVTGGCGPYTYSWSPSTGLSDANIINPTINGSVSIDYLITITDQSGNSAIDTFHYRPFSIELTVDSSCGNNYLAMISAVTNTNSYYSWTKDGMEFENYSSNLTVTEPGVYQVTATNSINFCEAISPNIIITSNTGNSAPLSPNSINGNQNVCNSLNQTYSIDPVIDASSYNWSVSSGIQIISDNQTSVILQFDNNFTSGNICVSASNSCGASSPTCLNIVKQLPTVGPITGNFRPCRNIETYSIPVVDGAIGYEWIVRPTQAMQVSDNTLTIDWSMATGRRFSIKTRALTNCGLTNYSSAVVTLSRTCRTGSESETIAMEDETANVYPNPFSNKTTITFEPLGDASSTIVITDINGRTILTKEFIVNQSEITNIDIDLSQYLNGIYYYFIQSENKLLSGKLILIK